MLADSRLYFLVRRASAAFLSLAGTLPLPLEPASVKTLTLKAVLIGILIAVQACAALSATIDVTRRDKLYVKAPLVANDRAQAAANTKRIERILAAAPAGAAIHFPAGDYYFSGSALPNHGTIETTQPGQIIYGDGADVTNIIQCDARKDFGFTCDPKRKRVPAATVRVRHKGCRVRSLSILIDSKLTAPAIIPSAAVQIAHIKYLPDNNIGIIETTGQGADYLIDFVNVTSVNVGRNLGPGVQSTLFFEVGVDIIGSGGEVKVFDMDRIDAKIGVRLDNGNHCGQGGYYFENLEMIGRHGLTNGGVFFDWVGGQAPFIRNCNSGFVSGMHAGALGSTGDRLEPTPEAEVVRRPGKTWDWFTLHGHSVVDDPNPAQRTEWYGLPRHARIKRIASAPRTGGKVWGEGKDYTTETIAAAGDLQYATKIHWKTDGPAPGSVYYVEFEQPKEYRVHDLEWGSLINCQLGEALQSGPEGYALKFEDQGFGYLNPDFRFGVGYGFQITQNMVLNGPFIFDGCVDYIRMESNTTGACDFRISGASNERKATRLSFSHNQLNSALIGDYVSQITFSDNDVQGVLKIDAPKSADLIALTGNKVSASGEGGIRLTGKITDVRVRDNDIRPGGGDGISLGGVTDAIVSGNNASDCPGSGIVLKSCDRFDVFDNIANRNQNGILIEAASSTIGQVHNNACSDNKKAGLTISCEAGKLPAGLIVKDNQCQVVITQK